MRIAISGTSGVGKTFLENVLASSYGFNQLPKTTSRKKRPGEIEGQGIFFKPRSEIENNISSYFFYLEYADNIYAWTKDDLEKHKDVTIAITMESLVNLIKLNLNFIPILLYISQSNTDFLIERIKTQLNYSNLDRTEKSQADIKIEQRLQLADEELKNIDKYIDIVHKVKHGRAFKIEDNQTIYTSILPYIESLKHQGLINPI